LAAQLCRRKKYEEGQAYLNIAINLGLDNFNTHETRGDCFLDMGMYKDAIGEFQKAVELSNGADSARTGLAQAYAVAGEKIEARKILRELVQEAKPRHHFVAIARIYRALGERDEALKYLEYAYRERLPGLRALATGPGWEPLRSDPHFKNLMQRIGFPPIPNDSESRTDVR